MQVMDRCVLDIELPKDESAQYRLAKAIVNVQGPGLAGHYFVSSSFTRKRENQIPLLFLRLFAMQFKVHNPEKAIMFLCIRLPVHCRNKADTSSDQGLNFYVYGFNKDERDGNVIFKTFSEQGFVDDLASAAALC
jgi:hypothetical protein